MTIDVLTPLHDGTIAKQTAIGRYIVVYRSGETYVAWAVSPEAAREEAIMKSAHAGSPWKVLLERYASGA